MPGVCCYMQVCLELCNTFWSAVRRSALSWRSPSGAGAQRHEGAVEVNRLKPLIQRFSVNGYVARSVSVTAGPVLTYTGAM